MTGPRPAGRPWTAADVIQLCELIAAGMKVGVIARKLKRSPGAIHARISSLKNTVIDEQRLSLPSERLTVTHQVRNRRLVELGLEAKRS
jgi:hypothetical protein